MTPQQAKRCAHIALQAFKFLTSSEAAAQATIGVTPQEFDEYALGMLVKAFTAGTPTPLPPRIDATHRTPYDQETGDYFFGEEKVENLQNITYTQGLLALEKYPQKVRQLFKRAHAQGLSAWEAYNVAIEWWENNRPPDPLC